MACGSRLKGWTYRELGDWGYDVQGKFLWILGWNSFPWISES
jgi:hypothetical protein